LIEDHRQWFKAEIGLGVRETPLDSSICAHAILQPGLFVVPDTSKDPRFDRNPLVTGEPYLRFYAGALLQTPEGLPLGTVCVLDDKPRDLTDEQAFTLQALARQVMAHLELRASAKEAERRTLRCSAMLNSFKPLPRALLTITAAETLDGYDPRDRQCGTGKS
jgi:GAF domain-containing protein